MSQMTPPHCIFFVFRYVEINRKEHKSKTKQSIWFHVFLVLFYFTNELQASSTTAILIYKHRHTEKTVYIH